MSSRTSTTASGMWADTPFLAVSRLTVLTVTGRPVTCAMRSSCCWKESDSGPVGAWAVQPGRAAPKAQGGLGDAGLGDRVGAGMRERRTAAHP
ncbi:hypothetical protein ACFYYR_06715 [Streptomyces sp. NPDC001922]|uniref:hypothetical protein n=1 Tax=Streptomyces sp. NPDC001922 TaxID=3364624 RepID=UPI0036A3B082